MKMAKFIGGTADSRTIAVQLIGGRFPPVFYTQKLISLEEADALQIDDTTAWRPPEEVYKYAGDGTYKYERTVEYKPK